MRRLKNLKPGLKVLTPTVGQASGGGGSWAATQQGTTTERGYGWQWQKLRLRILARDQYRCQCAECKAEGRITVATDVDHIVEREDGGSDDPSNLQAMGHECHKRKTQAARRARMGGGGVGTIPGGARS